METKSNYIDEMNQKTSPDIKEANQGSIINPDELIQVDDADDKAISEVNEGQGDDDAD